MLWRYLRELAAWRSSSWTSSSVQTSTTSCRLPWTRCTTATLGQVTWLALSTTSYYRIWRLRVPLTRQISNHIIFWWIPAWCMTLQAQAVVHNVWNQTITCTRTVRRISISASFLQPSLPGMVSTMLHSPLSLVLSVTAWTASITTKPAQNVTRQMAIFLQTVHVLRPLQFNTFLREPSGQTRLILESTLNWQPQSRRLATALIKRYSTFWGSSTSNLWPLTAKTTSSRLEHRQLTAW